MITASSVMFLKPEFDDFLFAPIEVEKNDMPLSVLSAFTRLGIDPWEEAAHLTGLPREEASRRLVQIIARLPGRQRSTPESGAIVARLIQLLPKGEKHAPSLPNADRRMTSRSTEARLLIAGISAAILIVIASHYEASMQRTAQEQPADTSSIGAPPPSPPSRR